MPVSAEILDLVCMGRDGFTTNLKIDTTLKTVLVNGSTTRDVSINSDRIAFYLDLSGKDYFHTINRSTGSLAVQFPDGSVLTGQTCDRATKKF